MSGSAQSPVPPPPGPVDVLTAVIRLSQQVYDLQGVAVKAELVAHAAPAAVGATAAAVFVRVAGAWTAYCSPVSPDAAGRSAPRLDAAWVEATGSAAAAGAAPAALAAALGAPPEQCRAAPLRAGGIVYGALVLAFARSIPHGAVEGAELLARQLAGACEQEQQVARERDQWRQVVEQMGDIVVVTGPDGEPVYVNPEAGRFSGRPLPEVPLPNSAARPYRMWRPDGSWYAPEDVPSVRAARHGEITLGEEIFIEVADGSTRLTSWNTMPLHDAAGDRIGAVSVGRDITALRDVQRAAERRVQELEGLRDISGLARLGATPDAFYGTLAERIAHLLRADSCVVSEWDETAETFRPLGGFGRAARATPIGSALPAETSRLTAEVFSAQPILIHAAAPDPAVRRLAAIIDERLGFRTALGVRLVVDGRTVGALVALRRAASDLFDDHDSRLLEIIAAQAAQEVRSYQEERAQQAYLTMLQGLWELAQLGRSAVSSRAFYSELTAHVALLLDADCCFVLRYEPGRQVLRPVAAFGLEPGQRPSASEYYAGPGSPYEAALTGQPTQVHAGVEDPRLRAIAQDNLDLGFGVALGIGLYADGKIVGSVAVARRDAARLFTDEETRLLEIIARPVAQEIEAYRLRRTLQRIREVQDAILRHLPDSIVVYDRQGRVIFANEVAEHATEGVVAAGRHIEEIKAEFRARGITGGAADGDTWLTETTLTEGLTILHQRFPVVRPGQAVQYVDFSSVPIRDAGGTIQGAAVVYRDITEQVEAEQRNEGLLIELEASEGRFRSIVNHIDSAVMVRDTERVIYTNEKYRELFGFERDVVGMSVAELTDLVAPCFADGTAYRTRLLPADNVSLEPYRNTFEIILPQRRFVERISSPIRGGSGEIFGRIVEYRDLTREHQMVIERDTFLERTAFVLRSDLGLPTGELLRLLRQLDALKISLETGGVTPDHITAVETTVREVNREIASVLEMIEKLRDLSRALEGWLEVTAEPHDLAETIEAALDNVNGLPPARVVRAGLDRGAAWVQGNPGRVRQVVRWLLENAVQYSPRTPLVVVRLLRGPEGMAQLRITDNGMGLEPDEAMQLFSCYYRSRRAADRWPRGLGISLYLARFIVERLGGTLRAESSGPGQGTTFVLELPLAP